MNRALLLISGIITLSLYACSQKVAKQDPYEQSTCDCFINKYDSLGIDIRKELKNLETHYVTSNILKNTTFDGYKDFFTKIKNRSFEPDSTFTSYRSSISLDSSHYYFIECVSTQNKLNSSTNIAFHNFFSGINIDDGSSSVEERIVKIIDLIDKKEYQKQVYKLYLLTGFTDMNHQFYLKEKEAQYLLTLTLNSDLELKLNGELTNMLELSDKLKLYKGKVPEEDMQFFVVHIKVTKDVPMSEVVEIKQQLKKANTLKISYSVLKEE